MTCKCS